MFIAFIFKSYEQKAIGQKRGTSYRLDRDASERDLDPESFGV